MNEPAQQIRTDSCVLLREGGASLRGEKGGASLQGGEGGDDNEHSFLVPLFPPQAAQRPPPLAKRPMERSDPPKSCTTSP
jgi:hypothetical protein